MAYYENPTYDKTFDPDWARGDSGTADDDAPFLRVVPTIQQGLHVAGDNIPRLQGELRQTALDDQNKSMVDTFYDEVEHAYGLRLKGRLDFNQFGIDDDGKILYWTPGDKKITITATRGGFQFLGLPTLAKGYGIDGTNAIRQSMGLTDYKSNMPRLNKEAAEKLQKTEETLSEAEETFQKAVQTLSKGEETLPKH